MPQLAWVKNETKSPQFWGRHEVRAGALGLIPVEAVSGALPPGVQVVSGDPERWIFRRTDHAPSSPRYANR